MSPALITHRDLPLYETDGSCEFQIKIRTTKVTYECAATRLPIILSSFLDFPRTSLDDALRLILIGADGEVAGTASDVDEVDATRSTVTLLYSLIGRPFGNSPSSATKCSYTTT